MLYGRGTINKGRAHFYFLLTSLDLLYFELWFILYLPFLFRLFTDPGSKSCFVFCFLCLPWKFYRYKRLLCTVDLTKDFFFSYSYHIMHTLQRNLSNNAEGHTYYESMFVWNEYLTRRIRNTAKDCMWTVALVYGFFKQVLLVLIGPKVSIIFSNIQRYAYYKHMYWDILMSHWKLYCPCCLILNISAAWENKLSQELGLNPTQCGWLLKFFVFWCTLKVVYLWNGFLSNI